jgi:hypothetical protein
VTSIRGRLALAAGALLLSACGGRSVGAAITGPPPSVATAGADVSTSVVVPTVAAPPAAASAAAPPATAAPAQASSGPVPATAAAQPDSPDSLYCQLARAYQARQGRLINPVGSADDLRQFFRETQREIDAAVAVAPPGIDADVRTVAGAVSTFVAALEKANYDVAKVPPAARSALATPTFKVASTHVQSYARQVCGVR